MQRDRVNDDNLCERVAEAIFLELIGNTEHHFKIAQRVVQYLDSTPEIEKTIKVEITVPISLPPNTKKGHCKSVIDEVQQKLAQNFGGFTTTKATGGWYDGNDTLVEEPSRKITANLPIGAWVHVTDVLKSIIVEIQESLKQRCVYVTIHNTSYPLNLVADSSEFPSQEKFLGMDPEVIASDKNVKPRKPHKLAEKYAAVDVDVEYLKAELEQLKKTIKGLVDKDEKTISSEKSVQVDNVFEDTIEIGARVLSMDGNELTELGDLAYATGKTSTAELYYYHAKSKFFDEENYKGYADVLIDLANVCFRRSMFEASRSLIIEAMIIFQEHNYETGRGIDAIVQLGDTFALENDVEQAWAMYSFVARIAIDSEDYSLAAMSMIRLGNVSLNYQQRVDSYRNALAIHQKYLEPKSMSVASCMINLGFALQGTGEYGESRDVLLKAKIMGEELENNDPDFKYQIFEKLADLEKNEGNLKTALKYSEEALKIARQIENPSYECSCLVTLANISHLMCNPQQSEKFNELVLEIASGNNLTRYLGQYYGRAAQIALDRNQIDVAKSFLHKEQELCYKNELLYDAMFSELFLAKILLEENDMQGISHLQKGMSLGQKLEQFDAFKLGTTMLVNQLMKMGDYDSALNLNNELIKSLENRGGSKHDLSGALHNSGLCLYYQSKAEDSLEYFSKSEEIAKHLEDKHHFSLLQANKGRAYAKLGNRDEAEIYFNKALKLAKENQFNDLITQIQKERDSQ